MEHRDTVLILILILALAPTSGSSLLWQGTGRPQRTVAGEILEAVVAMPAIQPA